MAFRKIREAVEAFRNAFAARRLRHGLDPVIRKEVAEVRRALRSDYQNEALDMQRRRMAADLDMSLRMLEESLRFGTNLSPLAMGRGMGSFWLAGPRLKSYATQYAEKDIAETMRNVARVLEITARAAVNRGIPITTWPAPSRRWLFGSKIIEAMKILDL